LGDATEGIAAIENFLGVLPRQRTEEIAGGGLSAREIEVLRLLAAGRSNQQELVLLGDYPACMNRRTPRESACSSGGNV
jgi:hypothetical protein